MMLQSPCAFKIFRMSQGHNKLLATFTTQFEMREAIYPHIKIDSAGVIVIDNNKKNSNYYCIPVCH